MQTAPLKRKLSVLAFAVAALAVAAAGSAQLPPSGGPSGGPPGGGPSPGGMPPGEPPGGRPPRPPPPTVISLGTFGLVVDNLDKAVRFYRDVIGLDVITPPTKAMADEAVDSVMNTPGAKLRYARLRIANEPYALELDEFSAIERTAAQANHNDPGASMMNFGVWDGNTAFTTLRKANPQVLSARGIPDSSKPGVMNMVWIRDPDGHLIELMQGGWDSERKSMVGVRNVYRGHFAVTLQDANEALTFYRDLLGFDITAGFGAMAPAGKYTPIGFAGPAMGISKDLSMAAAAGHCAEARCEFFDYRGGTRTPFHPSLQNPGASYLAVWVSDLDQLLPKIKAAGLTVVTLGGEPISVTSKQLTLEGGTQVNPPVPVKTSRQIMIRDYSGFPIILMQRVD